MSKFVGVDIGTGSVRAGLFSSDGNLEKVSVKEIRVNNPEPGYYEQSSEEIWQAVCFTVKEVAKAAKNCEEIGGIAFCATCSLVAIDGNHQQVSIDKNENPDWNIVMWMDHRAEQQADFINTCGHEVLKYVGGAISLEMETPKLLWLKQNLPASYSATTHYFDLADYIRWRATGSSKRSICCTVCKWTFVNTANPHVCSWDKTYFEQIGLADVFPKIGETVSSPGDSDLISKEAASELGLDQKTKVGYSMIDAHSGVLGMIGCNNSGKNKLLSSRFCIICGTSNCHMALSENSLDIKGVWGPYYGVILQNLYLSEGGQSAAGKLLDHIVNSHAAYPDLLKEFKTHGAVLSKLEDILVTISTRNNWKTCTAELTKDLHIWPDFHGNRSPLADPTLRGMISGLTLATSREDLAILYLATIQSLAYGSRHIKEAMEKAGHEFKELVICGGLSKSKLFVQSHADSTGLPVIIPECNEPVLLGAAISAAAAYLSPQSLESVLAKMAGKCTQVNPQLGDKEFHDRKYKVFLRMIQDQLEYKKIMNP